MTGGRYFGILAALVLAFAQYWALFRTPPDRMMGDLYRILYVHVPAAWMAMLFFTLSFVGSVGVLLRKTPAWDRFAHAAAELGVVLTGLALALGSLWAKPVWGVWWTWDPRLTTTALLFIIYSGTLILRRLIGDPERRRRLFASVGILAFLNVPIVYLSVKWWRGIHQLQSSPSTMSPEMAAALRMSALALLGVCLVLFFYRLRLARREASVEEKEAIPPGEVS